MIPARGPPVSTGSSLILAGTLIDMSILNSQGLCLVVNIVGGDWMDMTQMSRAPMKKKLVNQPESRSKSIAGIFIILIIYLIRLDTAVNR